MSEFIDWTKVDFNLIPVTVSDYPESATIITYLNLYDPESFFPFVNAKMSYRKADLVTGKWVATEVFENCPLPKGVTVFALVRGPGCTKTCDATELDWDCVISFKIIALAEGYAYPEVKNETS